MFFYSSRHQLALYSFPTRRSSDLIRIGVEPRVSEVPRRGPAVTTSEVVVTAGSVRREDGSGAGPLPALGRCSRRGSLLERLTTVVPHRSLRSTSTTAITKIHSASTKPSRRAARD